MYKTPTPPRGGRARPFASLVAAATLAAAVALPASAAPPTFTGFILCRVNGGGGGTLVIDGDAKKEINRIKRASLGDAPLDCMRKTFDDSGVFRDA